MISRKLPFGIVCRKPNGQKFTKKFSGFQNFKRLINGPFLTAEKWENGHLSCYDFAR